MPRRSGDGGARAWSVGGRPAAIDKVETVDRELDDDEFAPTAKLSLRARHISF